MTNINTITDIQQLVIGGFCEWKQYGEVSVKESGNLRLFNYTPAAQFNGTWNYFEMVCRGLILDAITGEIVARPFDKFFNWGEGNRYSDTPITNVTEKMDGSLGILYRDNGSYRVATRGSFDSDQALWATEYFNTHCQYPESIHDRFTFLFEIIYPKNRVVVDYGNAEMLVLLDVRDRFTGHYLRPYSEVQSRADWHGFDSPQVFQFYSPDQIVSGLANLGPNDEGWVVEFADGQRFKFKGEEYRRLHRLISGLSFKNTLECVVNGTLGELRSVIPDEFMTDVEGWVDDIQREYTNIINTVDGAFVDSPKASRKEFALWVMEYHKDISNLLFLRLDNKPIREAIYKRIADRGPVGG